MKRKIAIIIFSLIILSGCGDTTTNTTNTYTSQGAISVDNSKNDNSENAEGYVATNADFDTNTNVSNDKSTNNTITSTTNNIPESSVKDSDEYKQLEEENSNLRNQIDELESNNIDLPTIEYKDLGLSIDGEEIPINQDNSMISIDGRDYVSKEVMEKLISDNQGITIKDDTIFIGKVIADKANLFEQHIHDVLWADVVNTAKDAFGNSHSNVLYFNGERYHKITFSLNGKYSLLKMKVVPSEDADVDNYGNLVIYADKEPIHTFDNLNKDTNSFEEEIPINNCTLLTIEYNTDFSNEFLIYDAIIYN